MGLVFTPCPSRESSPHSAVYFCECAVRELYRRPDGDYIQVSGRSVLHRTTTEDARSHGLLGVDDLPWLPGRNRARSARRGGDQQAGHKEDRRVFPVCRGRQGGGNCTTDCYKMLLLVLRPLLQLDGVVSHHCIGSRTTLLALVGILPSIYQSCSCCCSRPMS